MDEQGLEAVLMFPTLACGIEQALRDDIPATMATLRAFNRWLDEDWGFSYQDRIIAVPMLSLADPDGALVELEWLLERGARMVHLRPAPVPTANGRGRSFGDPAHDPVWARLAEASVPVAFHLGDSGYEAFAGAWGARDYFEPFRSVDVLSKLVVSDRPIHDTIGSMVVDGVFDRHPTLRAASIENGSDWVHLLVKRLLKQANQTPWVFPQSPLETIQQHVWVTPYYEEDLRKLADRIGVEQVLFGSDWPHGEGLARPTDFVKELHAFSDDEVRRVMRDNCLDLLRSGSGRVTDTVTAPSDDDAALLADVSTWLADNWDPDLTVAEWWERVGAAGWSAPHFPREWGGLGYTRAGRSSRPRPPSNVMARCCRRPASGCSWPRPPSAATEPRSRSPGSCRRSTTVRSGGASCSANRARARTSPVSPPARRATATAG